jgi:hypothetical protein
MNKKTKNISIILAGFLLVGYIFALILITNYKQSQLEDSINREIKSHIKNRANTLEFFFKVSKKEISYISENDSIKNFFTNKALGMSMEYGLKSNLTKIEQELKQNVTFQNINNVNIFKDISLVDLEGKILASSDHNSLNKIRNLTFTNSNELEIYTKEINNKLETFIIKKIYYHNELIGRIITTINLKKIFNQLITSQNSNNCILYLSKNFTTLDSKKINNDILKNSNSIHIKINDSPFTLLTPSKHNLSSDFFFTNWLIIAISLFAIPLLISIYFLVWLNNKNIRLNEKIDNSIKEKKNLNVHNEKLQSEIKKRKDSESKLFLQANYDL